MFFAGKPFQLNLIFENRTLEWRHTQVGSGLTHKHKTRTERPAKDKHSSLLTFINDDRKNLYNTGSRPIKLFTVVIDSVS